MPFSLATVAKVPSVQGLIELSVIRSITERLVASTSSEVGRHVPLRVSDACGWVSTAAALGGGACSFFFLLLEEVEFERCFEGVA